MLTIVTVVVPKMVSFLQLHFEMLALIRTHLSLHSVKGASGSDPEPKRDRADTFIAGSQLMHITVDQIKVLEPKKSAGTLGSLITKVTDRRKIAFEGNVGICHFWFIISSTGAGW